MDSQFVNIPKENAEKIDKLLLMLESCLFSIKSDIKIKEEEIGKMISIVRDLDSFCNDYSLLLEEVSILWAKLEELEGKGPENST